MRGVRYWWAGLGLFVLVAMYVGPIVDALRQPGAPAPVASLSQIALPNVGFPLLRVPKVHAIAPLPPLRHARQGAGAAATPTAGTKTVRHRVPVVSDRHAQVPLSSSKSKAEADPFAAAPVVNDQVGTPMP